MILLCPVQGPWASSFLPMFIKLLSIVTEYLSFPFCFCSFFFFFFFFFFLHFFEFSLGFTYYIPFRHFFVFLFVCAFWFRLHTSSFSSISGIIRFINCLYATSAPSFLSILSCMLCNVSLILCSTLSSFRKFSGISLTLNFLGAPESDVLWLIVLPTSLSLSNLTVNCNNEWFGTFVYPCKP